MEHSRGDRTSPSLGAASRHRELVHAATKDIQASTSNPVDDLRVERQRASFSSDRLAEYMNGGSAVMEKRKRLIDLMSRQAWGDKSQMVFRTREQEHLAGLEGAIGIWKLMKEEGLSMKDAAEMRTLLFMPGGFELHIGMFIPSILSQGTDEQQSIWMPLCMDLKLIGTYAQTELGHGTFLRGLETVAVYDEVDRRFVIHSPTLTATKWWPGGLGKTCTHAILMARLITKGRDYGPHAFVVQLRDMETHMPLPGVEVGDIGPKMGYNGVDNGFLRFDHVSVPRDAMLMRYSQVLEDGTYVPPPPQNSKASYATMVYVRATIVRDAGDFLGRAATIATRYTSVRRQSSPDSSTRKELQILDYENVYETLIPIVAKSYALKFMGNNMMDMYDGFVKARKMNDFSSLPELHALSSGLKAFCTDVASFGIEECRRTCGGQGYSVLSGLPSIYTSYVQNVTWEGDNNVMYLQMARYLIKQKLKEQVTGVMPMNAMGRVAKALSPGEWTRPDAVLAALKAVESHLALGAMSKLRSLSRSEEIEFEGSAWNESTMDLIQLAKCRCRLVVFQAFVHEVSSAASSNKVERSACAALEEMCCLFGLSCLRESGADLLECEHVTPGQYRDIKLEFKASCRRSRANAVALVDAFGYEDYLLNSAIGRKDGNIYEALLAAAKTSPFNKTETGPGWDSGVLKDLLAPKSKL
jgi:acyl-CoA oxidase